jgi:DNA-binding NarL/FixJ family response regulator
MKADLQMTMNTSEKPIRIVMADDHPLLMDGFEAVLAAHGVKMIGKSTVPDRVLSLYEEMQPDVLMLDIRFGKDMTGLDTAKEVIKRFPAANIVFLSQFDQDSLIREAYRIGGRAFLTKSCGADELVDALKLAQRGENFFLPEVARRLANIAIQGDTSPLRNLDARELEVFKHMAQGLTLQEIAEEMGLSIKTISNTSQTIKDKVGLQRAAEITRLAVKSGLIEP